MVRTDNDSIYFDYNAIDSYGALMNYIIGARGDGKTFGYKKKCIDSCLKRGKAGAYIRRKQSELDKAVATWASDTQDKFPELAFRVTKDTAYLCKRDENGEPDNEWKAYTHFFALSTALKEKSASYPNVEHLCLDEFIIEDLGVNRYLKGEVELFLNVYETVARMRDIKMYLLANAFSQVNPYFISFSIELPNTKNGIKRISDDIVIQIAQDDRYKLAKKGTRFGKLIDGTEFAKRNIENQFTVDTWDWIGKKSQKAYQAYIIYVDDEPFAVYRDMSLDLLFISEDVNLECGIKFQYRSIGKASMTFTSRHRYQIIDDLVFNFERGNVRFENQRIKSIFMQLFTKIM